MDGLTLVAQTRYNMFGKRIYKNTCMCAQSIKRNKAGKRQKKTMYTSLLKFKLFFYIYIYIYIAKYKNYKVQFVKEKGEEGKLRLVLVRKGNQRKVEGRGRSFYEVTLGLALPFPFSPLQRFGRPKQQAYPWLRRLVQKTYQLAGRHHQWAS